MLHKSIAWGAKVPEAALPGLLASCSRLGLDPNNLVTCMMFESGLNPAAKCATSSATGLIQFMDATAVRLGTTTKKLGEMNFTAQLDYVELYFRGFMTHGHDLSAWTLCDTYMAILWPAAIGKPGTYGIFVDKRENGRDAYDVNRGLDTNGDHIVTKQEVCARINKLQQLGIRPDNVRTY